MPVLTFEVPRFIANFTIIHNHSTNTQMQIQMHKPVIMSQIFKTTSPYSPAQRLHPNKWKTDVDPRCKEGRLTSLDDLVCQSGYLVVNSPQYKQPMPVQKFVGDIDTSVINDDYIHILRIGRIRLYSRIGCTAKRMDIKKTCFLCHCYRD